MISSLSNWMDPEARADLESITNDKEKIISGFLSIGNIDGYNQNEGNSYAAGLKFVRFTYRKFYEENKNSLSEYETILKTALCAFSPSCLAANRENVSPRVYIDATATGWDNHAIVRLVGNVASTYRPNGPFFEVLVNSARTHAHNDNCNPFKPSVFKDKADYQARTESIRSLTKMNVSVASPVYYSSKLDSPEDYSAYYKQAVGQDPGPNATRLLEGLIHLRAKNLKAQRVGNCWMKQQKRALISTLFIETLTQRPELSHPEAWRLAKILYKKWKTSALNEIKIMLDNPGITLELRALAFENLRSRESKTLL